MRVALLADTHFGIRGDSQIMLDHQQKFFDNVFFPYIKDNQINHIIHLGDLVDRRKYINYNTSKRMREMFLERITGSLVCDIILGNHDVTYKNTNDLNVLEELVAERYDNINIYTSPTDVTIYNRNTSEPITNVSYIPWITDDNREKTFELLNSTTTQLAFAHLELEGFLNNDGILANGEDPKLFQKFDMVMTGHFHNRVTKDNIYYLGCPYQMSWNDYNDPKGFHVFDIETRKLQFIPNPHKLFIRLNYNDSVYTLDQMIKEVDEAGVTDAFIKIVVEEKTDPYKFDLYITHIESLQPCDLKVIETKELAIDTDVDHAEETLSILKKSISSLDVSVDKTELEKMIVNVYNRAVTVEI